MAAHFTAANRAHVAELNPVGYEASLGTYGGLVGQLIQVIDVRMTANRAYAEVTPSREDLLHAVSVCAGYAGLVAGFGAVIVGFCLILY